MGVEGANASIFRHTAASPPFGEAHSSAHIIDRNGELPFRPSTAGHMSRDPSANIRQRRVRYVRADQISADT